MNGPAQASDIVIIGGGFAGLTAGLRATELGLRAVLLEKGVGRRYPCNSRYSGGIVHVGFRDIQRTPQELLEAVQTTTAGEADPAQARALVENIGRWVDWLQQHGARFMRFNMEEAYRWCMAPPRALVPGLDWQGRGPDVLLSDLMDQFVAAGGIAHQGTRALRLHMDGAICRGVVAEQDGREIQFHARATLIADGGFQADRGAFSQNIGPSFEAVFQRGAATGMGDGMRMAESVGARMTARNVFYGHLLAKGVHENDRLWPYPELDAFATAGVILGPDGRRFTNEAAGGIAVANELARLSDPACAVAIFDADIWEGPGRAHRIPANPLLEQAGADIVKAPSLQALATQLGLPVAAVVETIEEHNAAIEAGNGAALRPPREGRVAAHPIRTAPFMAIRMVPGITYTMGGIAVDGSARVLSTNDTPIEGLFAAGAATGGLEGGSQKGYVGGIAKAGVFGLLAAETVAQEMTQSRAEAAPRAPSPAPSVTAHTPVSASQPQPAASPRPEPLATDRRDERFAMLKLIVRYGRTASGVLAALVGLGALPLLWPLLGWLSVPIASVAAGLGYVVLRSYTEMVTLITEMLMPE